MQRTTDSGGVRSNIVRLLGGWEPFSILKGKGRHSAARRRNDGVRAMGRGWKHTLILECRSMAGDVGYILLDVHARNPEGLCNNIPGSSVGGWDRVVGGWHGRRRGKVGEKPRKADRLSPWLWTWGGRGWPHPHDPGLGGHGVLLGERLEVLQSLGCGHRHAVPPPLQG
eukprot:EG_transcript_8575